MSKERFNNGAAWRVKDKKSDRHPGYSGTANVDGVLYFVDVWVKEHEGNKFLSFNFKKREKQEGAATLDENDDVPL